MLNLFRKITGATALDVKTEQINEAARTVVLRRHQPSRRNFKGADVDRLQSNWNPAGQSNDASIRMGLRKMRLRSRELYYNNEYAKHFCRLLKNNVVGAGIRLQAKAKDPDGTIDRAANHRIEDGWKAWGKRGVCDVTGKLSWVDVLRLCLETTARDGELLVRKVRGYRNAFGFALQLIEADHLDENLNGQLPNGNIIRMGIEFNGWDRPVAYHVLRSHPGDYIYGHQRGSQHERIPAADIIHLHLPEFVRQSRGVPWLHAAMARLKKMDSYEWSELIASNLAANKMAFYEADPEADPSWFDSEDDDGEFIEESEAGTFGVVPLGYRLKEFDPQHPAGNYDPFMKRMMRGFSSGAGLSYVSLGNDLSEVNFSSIRFGTEEDRDFYKGLQNWMVEWLCDEVYAEWLPAAMLSGQVALPFSKLDKFRSIVWRPRRWGYINPIQDATSKDKQLKYGGLTLTDLHAEQGSDYEEYLETLAEEKALEEEYKVRPPAKQEQLQAKV